MAKNPSTEVSALLGGSSGSVGQVLSTNTPANTSALTNQLTTITTQLQALQTINQSQMQSIEANTSALGANTGAKSGGSSTAGSVGNTLLDVLGLGSGLSRLSASYATDGAVLACRLGWALSQGVRGHGRERKACRGRLSLRSAAL